MAVTAMFAGAAVAGGAAIDTHRTASKARQAAEKRQREMISVLEEEEPAALPRADEAAAQRARRRSLQRQRGRGGRASTLLSDVSRQPLGG